MRLRLTLMLILSALGTAFAEPITRRSAAIESGQAAVFVVDGSPRFASMGGECVKLGTDSTPGANKRLLVIAKGPARSIVVIVAFQASSDRLMEKLSPIVVEQTIDSTAARFPREELGELWLFDKSDMRADLFIVVGQQDDSRIALIQKDIEAVQAAPNVDTSRSIPLRFAIVLPD